MKQYPSIGTTIVLNEYYVLFDKLDGSNFRAEWSKKKGFYKFGSRNRLVDQTSGIFSKAIELLKLRTDIDQFLREKKIDNATLYFEFYGENSFAGSHQSDDQMFLTFIDANIYKKGFLETSELMSWYEVIGGPKTLYTGKIDSDLIELIRSGSLDGCGKEGVIARPISSSKNGPKICKIKTRQWLNDVRMKGLYDSDDEPLF